MGQKFLSEISDDPLFSLIFSKKTSFDQEKSLNRWGPDLEELEPYIYIYQKKAIFTIHFLWFFGKKVKLWSFSTKIQKTRIFFNFRSKMTGGRSPTKIFGNWVHNDPFGHQKHFRPLPAGNRPFLPIWKCFSHFCHVFDQWRHVFVFSQKWSKIKGRAPLTEISDDSYWKMVFYPQKKFGAPPADFRPIRPIFQKSKPKNEVIWEKVGFFGFSKIEFFRKITQKFLRGGPDFLAKKTFFMSKSQVSIMVPDDKNSRRETKS